MLQSFLANRTVISATDRAAMTPPEEGFRPLFSTPARGDHGRSPLQEMEEAPAARLDAPQIELVQENGVVCRIIVTCRCCERIEIECQA